VISVAASDAFPKMAICGSYPMTARKFEMSHSEIELENIEFVVQLC
jgi:hypothetical protein